MTRKDYMPCKIPSKPKHRPWPIKEEKFPFHSRTDSSLYTVGGAPHLDGSYTVFGEVVEGMETVEKIEIAKTNRADRPLDNIRILKATVVE